MGYPFYHIKKCLSKSRTHSEAHRLRSKITKLVPITERQLKTEKNQGYTATA